MALLERYIASVNEWQEFVKANNVWEAAAERAGFPPRTLYRYESGVHPTFTYVAEYLWESHADREAKYASIWQDPELEGFGNLWAEAVEWYRIEYLWKLDAIE